MTNLLSNPGFNGDWWRKTHTGQEFGEIFVPVDWVAFWKEVESGDPDVKVCRPEMHVINFEPPYIDPPRVYEEPRAVKAFTFFCNHDLGYYQEVNGLTVGARYIFEAQAHAWYSQLDRGK